jgi:predicted acyltransferase
VQGWRRWSRFFEIYGTNPMIAFLGSGIMARLTVSILKVETPTGARAVSAVTHEALFASWLPSKVASLAYAVSFVLVWFVILRVLWQRKIFLKV